MPLLGSSDPCENESRNRDVIPFLNMKCLKLPFCEFRHFFDVGDFPDKEKWV